MGGCFSSSVSTTTTAATTTTTKSSTPTAIVISIKGTPSEHPLPITVSKALGIDHLSCFLCNSDSLSYNSPIPKLFHHDLLERDQIYFVRPKSEFGRVLSSNDMVEMAIMASNALKLFSWREGSMMPKINAKYELDHDDDDDDDDDYGSAKKIGMSRENSTKFVRNASSWVKSIIRRSFRRTLSDIVEGEIYV